MRKLLSVFLMLLTLPVMAGNVFVEPSRDLVKLSVKIGAGQYSYNQLVLTGGSTLYALFTVKGGLNHKLNVWLLDEPNFQLYQARQRYSYYEGTSGEIRGVGQYKFQVPASGRYYLVLDNGQALMLSRTVSLYAFEVYPSETQLVVREREAFEKLYGAIKSLFVFKDFKISVQHCGTSNAWSSPDITLCRELDSDLNQQGLSGAMFFVFMHELGHTLLKLWDYPLWDNEDVADEFATVMTILTEQQSMAKQAAQWWATSGSKSEALSKLYVNDRHTISPQRARNIDQWLSNSNDLIRRWQKIFVPNMTTVMLKDLAYSSRPWVDHTLMRAELAKRTDVNTPSTTKATDAIGTTREGLKLDGITPDAAVANAIDAASPIRAAIDMALSGGLFPGQIPTDPSKLALKPPSAYANELVQGVSYDRMGYVTVHLTKHPALGRAGGRKIVLTPLRLGNSVRWSYGFASTVSRNMLPRLP
jgi:hypothetical protein